MRAILLHTLLYTTDCRRTALDRNYTAIPLLRRASPRRTGCYCICWLFFPKLANTIYNVVVDDYRVAPNTIARAAGWQAGWCQHVLVIDGPPSITTAIQKSTAAAFWTTLFPMEIANWLAYYFAGSPCGDRLLAQLANLHWGRSVLECDFKR